MFETIKSDLRAAMERDPACRGAWDVVFSYPGFHAVLIHRLSHRLWERGFYFLA